MNRKTAVVIGLARNCELNLARVLGQVEALSQELDDWGYVFLENDSRDDTLPRLKEFHRKHNKGIIRSFPRLRRKLRQRTERLAWLRNQALEIASQDSRLSKFEYAILIDMDEIVETIPRERIIAHMTAWPADCAGIFSNQSDRYYDVWALRHDSISPDDCWKRIRERPATMSESEALDRYVEARTKPWPRNSGLIEVESAFGGLGVYLLSAVENCSYLGLDDDGQEICEHVEFHRQIREKRYRLFIDPEMINGSGTAEALPAKSKPIWIRALRTLRQP